MKAEDVSIALSYGSSRGRDAEGYRLIDNCMTADIVLGFLRKIRPGCPWWVRIGIDMLVGHIEQWQRETCNASPAPLPYMDGS